MRGITSDLWKILKQESNCGFCITVNGNLKKSGDLIMGKGIAKEALDRYPGIDSFFGDKISQSGVGCYLYPVENNNALISFPTKKNWWQNSDINLIMESCWRVKSILDTTNHIQKIYLPRPGCGLGKLCWNDVKIKIEKILDNDNFIIVHNSCD